ncbi:MAG: Hsp20/alpha crystallin family protein [Pseudomonadota bacterium]
MVEKTPMAHWWPEFLEPFRAAGERVAHWFQPRSDAAADNGAYTISLELPGVAQEDIHVELHDGVLSVRGEKREEKIEAREGYFFSERQYGRFQRTFRLPADAQADGVEAAFKDGILRISVPKLKAAAPGAQRVEVKSG